MALSRPLLLALLGIALLGATAFAVQNARNSSTNEAAPVAQPAQSSAGAAQEQPAAELSPQQTVQAAFTNDRLKSAAFDASVSFSAAGQRADVKAEGAFEVAGPSEMPKTDVTVKVHAQNVDFEGGFVSTGDKAWFTRGDTAYVVPEDTWSTIVGARRDGAGGQGSAAAPKLNIDPSKWLRDVKSEDGGQVDGVDTTHVSADISSASAVADVVKAMNRSGELPTALPPGVEKRASQLFDDASVDVWVGDDQILRRATLEVSGKAAGGQAVNVDVNLELSGVNKPQDIAGPSHAKEILPGGAYGQFTTAFLNGVGGTVGVDPATLGTDVPTTNAHLKAERAVAKHRKVVIFFENPRGLDDRAVAGSVRALDRNTKRVVVLTDRVENVDRYGSVIEDLGVNQAPSVVVIDRNGKGRLIEGYIDAETLAQVVADAR